MGVDFARAAGVAGGSLLGLRVAAKPWVVRAILPAHHR